MRIHPYFDVESPENRLLQPENKHQTYGFTFFSDFFADKNKGGKSTCLPVIRISDLPVIRVSD